MTQEEKQLLLQDLCARLFNGVRVWYKYETWNSKKFATSIRLADEKIALSSKFNKEGDWFPVEEAGEILIKPYLRPLSSMTEEEEKEICQLMKDYNLLPGPDRAGVFCGKIVDWLNSHHFDFRGLIEKGLAIEAPKDMYITSKENKENEIEPSFDSFYSNNPNVELIDYDDLLI